VPRQANGSLQLVQQYRYPIGARREDEDAKGAIMEHRIIGARLLAENTPVKTLIWNRSSIVCYFLA
jgi:hypothetical protein